MRERLGATKRQLLYREMLERTKFLADTLVLAGMKSEPEISLLIGSDQIWKLLTNEVCWDADDRSLSACRQKKQGRVSTVKLVILEKINNNYPRYM